MTLSAREIIEANADGIKVFVFNYLCDSGITVQLLEVVTKELFPNIDTTDETAFDTATEIPRELIGNAMQDIMHLPAFSNPEYDLERVLDGAASFELLVRYARKLNPRVMPAKLIPTDQIVEAALTIFHEKKAAIAE